jgi:hypothetical protein
MEPLAERSDHFTHYILGKKVDRNSAEMDRLAKKNFDHLSARLSLSS